MSDALHRRAPLQRAGVICPRLRRRASPRFCDAKRATPEASPIIGSASSRTSSSKRHIARLSSRAASGSVAAASRRAHSRRFRGAEGAGRRDGGGLRPIGDHRAQRPGDNAGYEGGQSRAARRGPSIRRCVERSRCRRCASARVLSSSCRPRRGRRANVETSDSASGGSATLSKSLPHARTRCLGGGGCLPPAPGGPGGRDLQPGCRSAGRAGQCPRHARAPWPAFGETRCSEHRLAGRRETGCRHGGHRRPIMRKAYQRIRVAMRGAIAVLA